MVDDPALPGDSEAPESFCVLAELLGWRQAMRLCVCMGGGRVWVPRKVPHGHVLACAIGYPAAEALAATYGGEVLSVPKLDWLRRRRRNRRILAELKAGRPVLEVSMAHGVTSRTVETVRAANRNPSQ